MRSAVSVDSLCDEQASWSQQVKGAWHWQACNAVVSWGDGRPDREGTGREAKGTHRQRGPLACCCVMGLMIRTTVLSMTSWLARWREGLLSDC